MARGDTTLPPARTIDLRGSGNPAYGAVLADPTGRRAARMRRVGLIVAVLFLLWLFGLVLAGLGLIPLSDLPLGSALNRAQAPPELRDSMRPALPSPSDLVPARAERTRGVHAARAGAKSTSGGAAADGQGRKQSSAKVHRTTTKTQGNTPVVTITPSRTPAKTPSKQSTTQPAGSGTTTSPGNSGSAPGQTNGPAGQTQTSPGKSGETPKTTGTTPSGNQTGSGSTTTGSNGNGGSTTSGNSQNAPGHDPTRTTGNGNGKVDATTAG